MGLDVSYVLAFTNAALNEGGLCTLTVVVLLHKNKILYLSSNPIGRPNLKGFGLLHNLSYVVYANDSVPGRSWHIVTVWLAGHQHKTVDDSMQLLCLFIVFFT
jgi:hypothetical protein